MRGTHSHTHTSIHTHAVNERSNTYTLCAYTYIQCVCHTTTNTSVHVSPHLPTHFYRLTLTINHLLKHAYTKTPTCTHQHHQHQHHPHLHFPHIHHPYLHHPDLQPNKVTLVTWLYALHLANVHCILGNSLSSDPDPILTFAFLKHTLTPTTCAYFFTVPSWSH